MTERQAQKCVHCNADLDELAFRYSDRGTCIRCLERMNLECLRTSNVNPTCPYCGKQQKVNPCSHPELFRLIEGMGLRCDDCWKWFVLDVYKVTTWFSRRIVTEDEIEQATRRARELRQGVVDAPNE